MKYAALMILFSGSFASIVFEPYDDATGIIADHINNISFIDHHEYIYFNLNLSKQISSVGSLNESVFTISHVCSHLKSNLECDEFHEFLNWNVQIIKNRYHNIVSAGTRMKRSPFIAIFSLFSLLLSTFTYFSSNNKINSIIDINERHMGLTNATVQISSRAFESYATNLKTMNANLKTLFDERNKNELNRQLNKIIGLSSLAIFTHMQITDTIDNILNTQSVHKILELIDADLVDREIERIRTSLFPNTYLAGQKSASTVQILGNSLRLSSLSGGILKIHVKIPITLRAEKLFRLYKIPIKRGREYFIIKSLMPYVSRFDGPYLGISENVIGDCSKSFDFTLICPKPSNWDSTTCENDLLANKSNNSCEFQLYKPSNELIQVHDNSFICKIINPFMVLYRDNNMKDHFVNITSNGWLRCNQNGNLFALNKTFFINSLCNSRSCGTALEIKLPNLHIINWTGVVQQTLHQSDYRSLDIKNFTSEFSLITGNLTNLLGKNNSLRSISWTIGLTMFLLIILIIVCLIMKLFAAKMFSLFSF